jgi:hypothetical protein
VLAGLPLGGPSETSILSELLMLASESWTGRLQNPLSPPGTERMQWLGLVPFQTPAWKDEKYALFFISGLFNGAVSSSD